MPEHVDRFEQSHHYGCIRELHDPRLEGREQERHFDLRSQRVEESGVEHAHRVGGEEAGADEHAEKHELQANPLFLVLVLGLEVLGATDHLSRGLQVIQVG